MFITDHKELKKYSAEHRVWQGIAGIEVTRKGRIFACFNSGGTKEDAGNFAVLLKSDDGMCFEDPIAVVYDKGFCRRADGCLWIDPLERLWFTWAEMPENATYGVICTEPDADEIKWGEPFLIGHEVMMNKPTALSTGEWLFPIAAWTPEMYVWLPKEFVSEREKGSYVYQSNNQGQTFEILGKADHFYGKDCDEHMILELCDGRLAMYIRSFQGIAVSYSYDRGKSWSVPDKIAISGPGSRFFIRRLKSGRILLVNHVNFSGRNNLTALLSEDEGDTWKYSLLLDERDNVSYPDATECDDGFLYVIYDRERGSFKSSMEEVYGAAREILYAKITEEDIIAGKLIREGSKLKNVISKLDKYTDENPFVPGLQYSVEEYTSRLLNKHPQYEIEEIFQFFPIRMGMPKEWRNRLDDLIEKMKIETDKERKEQLVVEIVKALRAVSLDRTDDYPMVTQVKHVLLQQHDTELSMQELADKVGISKYYMLHTFKKVTGITVGAYIKMLKMISIKMLLLHTDKRITDIAGECGFDDPSYFAEFFVKEEGLSPSEYRKKFKIREK